MAGVLDARQPVDAVACVSDLAAFGALTECQRRGVSVPEDIMIAGFGAYDIADVALPGLTTMDAHSLEIGGRTGELLVALLRGGMPIMPPRRPFRISNPRCGFRAPPFRE